MFIYIICGDKGFESGKCIDALKKLKSQSAAQNLSCSTQRGYTFVIYLKNQEHMPVRNTG